MRTPSRGYGGLIEAVIIGLLSLKGIFWVCRDTALILDSRHWVSGDAVIARSWLDKSWNKGSPRYSLMMAYHFSVAGATYTGDRYEIPSRRDSGDEQYFRNKLAPYAPGSLVKILYDPKDPTRSVVTPPHFDYGFIICIGGVSLLLAAVAAVIMYFFVRSRFLAEEKIERYAA
jgi:hypothetical protein